MFCDAGDPVGTTWVPRGGDITAVVQIIIGRYLAGDDTFRDELLQEKSTTFTGRNHIVSIFQAVSVDGRDIPRRWVNTYSYWKHWGRLPELLP